MRPPDAGRQGFGAVGYCQSLQPFSDFIQSLIPRDALPLTAAALPNPFEGIVDAVGMIQKFQVALAAPGTGSLLTWIYPLPQATA